MARTAPHLPPVSRGRTLRRAAVRVAVPLAAVSLLATGAVPGAATDPPPADSAAPAAPSTDAASSASSDPSGSSGSSGSAADAAPAPLPPELEEIRAAQATELYGDPALRPRDERQVSLASLGDSQISGEGVGNYEEPTDGPTNWCHRSHDAAIHHTGIPADVTYNFACSGAATPNIRIDGTPQYEDELVQSDSLAIAARNTRVDTVLLVAGANDDLQFGPVITDCVLRWFLPFSGPCAPEYDSGWADRVAGLQPKVEATIADLHTVMSEAGYAREDYRLVVLGYPGPITPDIRDNPDFPGKIRGGCTAHTSDAGWGRDVAVPQFQAGIRAAAQAADATYLDASRLFHGHEVCTADTRVRGLTLDLSNPFPPDENSVRQSFHPNHRGHQAFAACLTQLHATDLPEASCADAAGTGEPRLHPGAWDDHFGPLVNEATGECVAATDGSSRNGTAVVGSECTGERDQGWWHDAERQTLHTELSHDRCLDVPDADLSPGAELQLHECHGETNQRFTAAGGTLSPTEAPDLCVTQAARGAPLTLEPCTDSPTQRFA